MSIRLDKGNVLHLSFYNGMPISPDVNTKYRFWHMTTVVGSKTKLSLARQGRNIGSGPNTKCIKGTLMVEIFSQSLVRAKSVTHTI